jgi:hypothetical protein
VWRPAGSADGRRDLPRDDSLTVRAGRLSSLGVARVRYLDLRQHAAIRSRKILPPNFVESQRSETTTLPWTGHFVPITRCGNTGPQAHSSTGIRNTSSPPPTGSACSRLSLPPNAPPGCRDNRRSLVEGHARHLPVLTFVESLVCCAGGRRSKRLELRKAARTESPRQLTAVWASVKMTDPCRPVGSKLQCSVRIARLHNAVFSQHRRVRVTSAVFASPPHGSQRIGRCIGHLSSKLCEIVWARGRRC